MARGENEKTGLGAMGVAIGVVFAAVCVLALAFVLTTLRGCDRVFGGTAPVSYRAEPFPGASATLSQIGYRATRLREQRGVTTVLRDAVDRSLTPHGYVASGSWGTPVALPYEAEVPELDGSCGVIAIEAQPGSAVTGHRSGSEPLEASLAADIALLATCGKHAVRIEGSGTAALRVYAFPGLDEARATALGVPAWALLSLAEAEAQLRALGWVPSDEIVTAVASPTSGYAYTSVPDPASGCVAWVLVAEDVTRVIGRWNSLQMGDDEGPRGMTGAVACSRSGSIETGTFDLETSTGTTHYLRAFTPTLATSPLTATPVLTILEAHVVDLEHASQPSALSAPP